MVHSTGPCMDNDAPQARASSLHIHGMYCGYPQTYCQHKKPPPHVFLLSMHATAKLARSH
eukprot:12547296-Prorocentrum_lima.AAC.1